MFHSHEISQLESPDALLLFSTTGRGRRSMWVGHRTAVGHPVGNSNGTSMHSTHDMWGLCDARVRMNRSQSCRSVGAKIAPRGTAGVRCSIPNSLAPILRNLLFGSTRQCLVPHTDIAVSPHSDGRTLSCQTPIPLSIGLESLPHCTETGQSALRINTASGTCIMQNHVLLCHVPQTSLLLTSMCSLCGHQKSPSV